MLPVIPYHFLLIALESTEKRFSSSPTMMNFRLNEVLQKLLLSREDAMIKLTDLVRGNCSISIIDESHFKERLIDREQTSSRKVTTYLQRERNRAKKVVLCSRGHQMETITYFFSNRLLTSRCSIVIFAFPVSIESIPKG